jgi:hypothetical protein
MIYLAERVSAIESGKDILTSTLARQTAGPSINNAGSLPIAGKYAAWLACDADVQMIGLQIGAGTDIVPRRNAQRESLSASKRIPRRDGKIVPQSQFSLTFALERYIHLYL